MERRGEVMKEILSYLPYVLMFMVATMIIYGWGLFRSQRAAKDDTKLLYSKGASVIKKALRENGGMTRFELRELIKDLKSTPIFSKRTIAVTNPDEFIDLLLPYLVTQKEIIEVKENGKTVYKLNKK